MFAERTLRTTARRRRGMDLAIYGLCIAAGAIALLPLVLVLVYLVVEGIKGWSPAFLVSPPGGITSKNGGALHAIIGTLEMTGIVLAVSRAVGETAPLLFTTLGSNFIVTDPTRPMSALPLYMFQNALNIGFPAARQRAWAAALTLVAIVLIFNILGRWLGRRTLASGTRT